MDTEHARIDPAAAERFASVLGPDEQIRRAGRIPRLVSSGRPYIVGAVFYMFIAYYLLNPALKWFDVPYYLRQLGLIVLPIVCAVPALLRMIRRTDGEAIAYYALTDRRVIAIGAQGGVFSIGTPHIVTRCVGTGGSYSRRGPMFSIRVVPPGDAQQLADVFQDAAPTPSDPPKAAEEPVRAPGPSPIAGVPPPPRRLSWLLTVDAIFGSPVAVLGWMLIALSAALSPLLTLNDISGPVFWYGVDRCAGRVISVSDNLAEPGGHSSSSMVVNGRKVRRFTYTFSDTAGASRSGSSFSSRLSLKRGDECVVEASRLNHALTRIQGARPSLLGLLGEVTLALSLVGLLMVTLPVPKRLAVLRLLRTGNIGSSGSLVIYDPSHPDRGRPLDATPIPSCIAADGSIVLKAGEELRALLCLLAPLIALLCLRHACLAHGFLQSMFHL